MSGGRGMRGGRARLGLTRNDGREDGVEEGAEERDRGEREGEVDEGWVTPFELLDTSVPELHTVAELVHGWVVRECAIYLWASGVNERGRKERGAGQLAAGDGMEEGECQKGGRRRSRGRRRRRRCGPEATDSGLANGTDLGPTTL